MGEQITYVTKLNVIVLIKITTVTFKKTLIFNNLLTKYINKVRGITTMIFLKWLVKTLSGTKSNFQG